MEQLASDRYGILDELGAGAMGKVYLAQDLLLNEKIALKILRKELLNDEQSQKRFLREISLTRKVTHPNVVRTYEAGRYLDQYFVSMEYVPGVTLKEYLHETPSDEAIHIFKQIAQGLSAIHKEDIIHRDLKLTNIIITPEKVIKITDFGIARPKTSELTTQDDMLGTATHMAPEIWRGDEATKQADLYSLGVILYELLTGILPFNASSPMELMYSHLHVQPTPPKNVLDGCPEHLNKLALDLLEKDLNKRVRTIDEVLLRLGDTVEKEIVPEPQVFQGFFLEPKTLDTDIPKIVPRINLIKASTPKTKLDWKTPLLFCLSFIALSAISFLTLKSWGDFYVQFVRIGGLLTAYTWGVIAIYFASLLVSAPVGAIISARFGIFSGLTNWLIYSCLPFIWGIISATLYFKENFTDSPSLIISLISDSTKYGIEYLVSLPIIQPPYGSYATLATIGFCLSSLIVFRNRAVRAKVSVTLVLLLLLTVPLLQHFEWPEYKLPIGPVSVGLTAISMFWSFGMVLGLRSSKRKN